MPRVHVDRRRRGPDIYVCHRALLRTARERACFTRSGTDINQPQQRVYGVMRPCGAIWCPKCGEYKLTEVLRRARDWFPEVENTGGTLRVALFPAALRKALSDAADRVDARTLRVQVGRRARGSTGTLRGRTDAILVCADRTFLDSRVRWIPVRATDLLTFLVEEVFVVPFVVRVPQWAGDWDPWQTEGPPDILHPGDELATQEALRLAVTLGSEHLAWTTGECADILVGNYPADRADEVIGLLFDLNRTPPPGGGGAVERAAHRPPRELNPIGPLETRTYVPE